MLEVRNLCAAYGTSAVLFGIELYIGRGEVVGLLGRNGMGKTTTLRAIMGILRSREGHIRFGDADLSGLQPNDIAQLGLGLVPEGRQIFPNLTVLENLLVASNARAGGAEGWTVEKIFELFPGLRQRRTNMGDRLSGGEQQMLAIGRALMTNPKLLILDEATEGLAPLIRQEIWRVLLFLKSRGQAILLVDKHVQALSRVADRHYVVEKGKIVWTGSSADLTGNPDVQRQYLGV